MPWKECHVVDERLRFVARLLDGERMATVCEEFGISRKTGYKIFERYKDAGMVGLTDRSRRPHRHANQLPLAVEKLIVRLKKEYPDWGAPKDPGSVEEALAGSRLPGGQYRPCRPRSTWPGAPAPTTRRPRLTGTAPTHPLTPNALWCADYKGEFSPDQSPVLLSPDHHRFRQSISDRVRGAVHDQGAVCLHRL